MTRLLTLQRWRLLTAGWFNNAVPAPAYSSQIDGWIMGVNP